jgi:hypothetical protein
MSLGSFRGITNNVMWAVADGVREVKIFADVNVADGKIHHLAGTVDRGGQRARLLLTARNVPVRVSARSSYRQCGAGADWPERHWQSAVGVIDEMRLSNIARSDFIPFSVKVTKRIASAWVFSSAGCCPRRITC